MKVRILGSGAGGGFPQWNCNCFNCSGLRNNSVKCTARTQSSISISDNGLDWILINASPDIRTQIQSFSSFQPARGKRDTAIKAIILVDSQIDHTTGLLSLREGKPLEIYCTDTVLKDLTDHFPVFPLLNKYCGVNRHSLGLKGEVFNVQGIDFQSFEVDGEAPPYSPNRHTISPGSNISLFVNKKLFYSPGLGKPSAKILEVMNQADTVLIDGTFWTNDEMVRAGVGKGLAHEMGHLPLSGENGMLSHLKKLKCKRKILIHINNTNPILNENSAERKLLEKEGIEVAFDGMEIEL